MRKRKSRADDILMWLGCAAITGACFQKGVFAGLMSAGICLVVMALIYARGGIDG